MKKILLLFSLLLSCQFILAQDSVFNNVPKEPKIYDKIENYSKKRRFTQFFHHLIFRDYNPNQKPSNEKSTTIKPRNENKIIRKIDIETLDPFGYSIENKKQVPQHFVEKFGNRVHRKTRNITVKNFLLFKEYDLLDSLKLKESERIIRSQRFARTVEITTKSVKNTKDSVDVLIRVLDSWSLIPTGSFSNSQANLNLNERNFMGLGHQFENNFARRFSDNINAYSTKYLITNFKNSFVNAGFSSATDLNNNTSKTVQVIRPFYSVFTNWAGGANYEYRNYTDVFQDPFLVPQSQNLKLKTYTFWLGHSFQLQKGQTENKRQTNFFITSGFKTTNYLEQPTLTYDVNGFYGTERTILNTIGIATQKFKQDKYIFNFGLVEDVPYGKVISVTSGVQNKNNTARAYFGSRFSYGNYYRIGYFSANFEIGSFFNNGNNQETTFKIEANYFTPLLPIGRLKFRQFINPTIVLGHNRNEINKDRLNLVDYKGIPGFTSSVSGTKKVSISLQSQLYIPKNWYGFNFSPFLNCSFGLLGDTSNATFNNRVYTSFSIGAVISNNYLIFNNFQVSFSYIPSIVNEGTNIIKTNSFQNSDLQFSNFQIGEPGIVLFR